MLYFEPRGTGKSEEPRTLEEYNQNYLVQEIENLRTKLNIEKVWLFGHSDQSSIAMIHALKFPEHVKKLVLSGTSMVGTQDESINRRKVSEAKQSKESDWFANVIKDWDYIIENNTTIKDNKDISNTPLKWWCFNDSSAQKVIPIAREISKQGRRKPINNIFYSESAKERDTYLNYQNEFNKIKSPVLIINGKYDTNTPPEFAEKLHNYLKNSTLIFISFSLG